jgi:hypothetical protein
MVEGLPTLRSEQALAKIKVRRASGVSFQYAYPMTEKI